MKNSWVVIVLLQNLKLFKAPAMYLLLELRYAQNDIWESFLEDIEGFVLSTKSLLISIRAALAEFPQIPKITFMGQMNFIYHKIFAYISIYLLFKGGIFRFKSHKFSFQIAQVLIKGLFFFLFFVDENLEIRCRLIWIAGLLYQIFYLLLNLY